MEISAGTANAQTAKSIITTPVKHPPTIDPNSLAYYRFAEHTLITKLSNHIELIGITKHNEDKEASHYNIATT